MAAGRTGAEIAGSAEGASRATEYIAAIQPDVMILDIQLSGGSGIEVYERSRVCNRRPLSSC